MSERIERYLALERELLELRQSAAYDESKEDALLEQMDTAWWALTPEEQQSVNSRRTKAPDKGPPPSR
jgi:hypothetical protein